MAKPIYFFTKNDDWFELSNFYPFGFEDDDKVYWPTVEHYFQAHKFSDEQYKEKIRNSVSAKQAKALGQTRTFPIIANWDDIKETVMKTALRLKFSHPKMKSILLSTKDRLLIENSPYDNYWGIGKLGNGKNRMGLLLMEVRSELQ